MKNMVEIEEENWRNKPLTEFAREKIEYAGKRKTTVMEVQVEPQEKPVRKTEAKAKEQKEPEIGNAPERIVLPYARFREVFNLLNTVVDEARFEFKTDGLHVRAMDPAHVALIDLHMPRSAFSEYYFEKDCEWAIDVKDLKKSIPKGSRGDVLSLQRTENRIKAWIGPFVKEYELLDPQMVGTKPKIPDLNPDVSFTMGQYELRETFKGASDVSDAIRFELNKERLTFRSFSDGGEFKAEFPANMIKEIVCNGAVKSSYPLEYLLKLFKAMKTVDEVKTSFNDDYPLIAEFRLASTMGMGERPEVKYLLAPRMEQ